MSIELVETISMKPKHKAIAQLDSVLVFRVVAIIQITEAASAAAVAETVPSNR